MSADKVPPSLPGSPVKEEPNPNHISQDVFRQFAHYYKENNRDSADFTDVIAEWTGMEYKDCEPLNDDVWKKVGQYVNAKTTNKHSWRRAFKGLQCPTQI